MASAEWIKPYGDDLVNLMASKDRGTLLKNLATNLPDIPLNDRQICDLEMLATGAFSPLKGFMNRTDYEAVLDRMRLSNGLLWPMPICLDITEAQAKTLEAGQSIALRDPEGLLLAVMHIEDIWPIDPQKEAEIIFQTTNHTHPGVRYLTKDGGQVYLGGPIEVVALPPHYDFRKLRMSPAEVRKIYSKLGWQRVVGFQTRHPIHRPQFEMTLKAMRRTKANLLILPVAGIAHPWDFDQYTRLRCYRALSHRYPPDAFVLSLLPIGERMAGPREAILHAIVAKNYGCTHFIVGHDHANPILPDDNNYCYAEGEALEAALALGPEIDVEIIPFEKMVYLPFEDEYRFCAQVEEGVQTIHLSDTDIRKRIQTGRRIPDWATFPEVLTELQQSYPPPRKQGMTIFLTGLSGAGKSTIARILYSRFLELGDRPVTLLDGDIIRRHLSSELNFSKEHRDINVRRIGFVASEITKNRGIAICAPIAPYAHTRNEIREMIEAYGGFVEIHVATPLTECEKRDRKGIYAKARAGLIKGFTGIDDPYEAPSNPEVKIDTTGFTPLESAQEVLLFLGEKGYI